MSIVLLFGILLEQKKKKKRSAKTLHRVKLQAIEPKRASNQNITRNNEQQQKLKSKEHNPTTFYACTIARAQTIERCTKDPKENGIVIYAKEISHTV